MSKELIINDKTYVIPDDYTHVGMVDLYTGEVRRTVINQCNKECHVAFIDDDLYVLDPDLPMDRIKVYRKEFSVSLKTGA